VSLILDSSVALAWLFSDEATPAILALFDQVIVRGAMVPSLWQIEIANSLTMAARKGRITLDERRELLIDLATLPILTDSETGARAWNASIKLADCHNLTLYDAVYLELALRRGLPLATLDMDLRTAANAEGVSLLGV